MAKTMIRNNVKGLTKEQVLDQKRVEAIKKENVTLDTRKNILSSNAIKALYETGNISGEQVKAATLTINGSLAKNKSRAFAIVAYSAGSEVGITTVAMNTALTLGSLPKQYFVGSKLSLTKIRKVLRDFGKAKEALNSGQRYESVFVEGLNVISEINEFGRVNTYVRVSKHEIQEFIDRIKELDANACSVEDLKLIEKDMDAIGRALQELAIDVAKDKSKDIGISISSFINVGARTLSRHLIKNKAALSNNLDAIIKEKNKNGVSANLPAYKMTVEEASMLSSVDPKNKAAIKECVIADIAGILACEIKEGYNETMNKLVDIYSMTNDSAYDSYKNLLLWAEQTNPEAKQMVKACRIALDTVHGFFASKEEGIKLDPEYTTEQCKLLRAALYTEGAKKGFTQTQIVKLAIASAFARFNEDNKITTINSPSLVALWAIFPREFIIEYSADNNAQQREDVLVTVLTPEYVEFDLMIGDELYFTEGECETDLGLVCTVEQYTGRAIVSELGLEACIEHYAYEPVEYLFVDSVCVENTQAADIAPVNPGYVDGKDADELAIQTSMMKVVDSTKLHTIWKNHLLVKTSNGVTVVGKVAAHSTDVKNMMSNAFITKKGGFITYTK